MGQSYLSRRNLQIGSLGVVKIENIVPLQMDDQTDPDYLGH